MVVHSGFEDMHHDRDVRHGRGRVDTSWEKVRHLRVGSACIAVASLPFEVVVAVAAVVAAAVDVVVVVAAAVDRGGWVQVRVR